jgi:hypothetical protein
MSAVPWYCCRVSVVVVAIAIVAAQARPTPPETPMDYPPQPIGVPPAFPVEDLKPGMIGFTYTVMKGTEIVPVRTEILGVARDGLGPGLDMIIGKLVDPKTELTGAVHGMSGSPLYIGGKLVGALSRRIASFEKDGHCGFTPIRDMLSVDEKLRQPPPASAGKGTPLPTDAIPRSPLAALLSPLPPDYRLAPGFAFRADPLAVPLSMRGLSTAAWSRLAARFGIDSTYLMPVQAGSGSSASSDLGPEALQPGAPAAAVMITGDIALGGTGTLTWRDGDRILAFGHPMLGLGPDKIALGTAEIITTVPSYMRPFKMANDGAVVGTVTQDRFSAIGGIVGPKPRMASYRITRTHEGAKRPSVEGTFLPHEQLTPLFVSAIMASSLADTDDVSRVFSVRLKGELHIAGHPPLLLNGLYAGDSFFSVIEDNLTPLLDLFRQRFEKLEAESLALDIATTERADQWKVESVRTDLKEVDPGASIRVHVELLEELKGRTWRTFDVTLPENLRQGKVTLRIAAAQNLNELEIQRHVPSARTVDEIIESFNRRRLQDRVYLQVVTPAIGEIVADQELPALPGTVAEVMRGGNRSNPPQRLHEQVWIETSMDVPGVVSGQREIEIGIR